MATNKNAQIRYQTLDRCFRNPGRKYFWEDLLEACNQALHEYNGAPSGIGRRQLFDDIRFMESEAGWSVPLERHREGRKTYYRYRDLDFSINNQPLNEAELHQLQSGMRLLSRFQGLPQLSWLEEILSRLQPGVRPGQLRPTVGFHENPYLKGMEHFGILFNAVTYRKVLEVQYQDFKAEAPYPITFHPYFLKQYNSRWFVFGYHPVAALPDWTLALDRIISIEETDTPYRDNDIDWEEYFEDIIGVTKPVDGNLTAIRLWFHPAAAPYVLTKPLHGSQRKLQRDERGLTIQLELIPNYEFYQTILSFGDRVRVLSPAPVAAHLTGVLREALAHYEYQEGR